MQTYATTQENARGLFDATAAQRLSDATRQGRDSDVHHGICFALATVGLIDHAEYRALELEVTRRCRVYYEAH